jgi:hypothetical protein
MAQMRCTNCGSTLVDDARFCTACGNPVINSASPSLAQRADPAASDSERFGRFLAFAGRFPFWLGLTPHRAPIEALRVADPIALLLTAAANFVLIVGSGLLMGAGKKLSAVRAEPLLASQERCITRKRRHFNSNPATRELRGDNTEVKLNDRTTHGSGTRATRCARAETLPEVILRSRRVGE